MEDNLWERNIHYKVSSPLVENVKGMSNYTVRRHALSTE